MVVFCHTFPLRILDRTSPAGPREQSSLMPGLPREYATKLARDDDALPPLSPPRSTDSSRAGSKVGLILWHTWSNERVMHISVLNHLLPLHSPRFQGSATSSRTMIIELVGKRCNHEGKLPSWRNQTYKQATVRLQKRLGYTPPIKQTQHTKKASASSTPRRYQKN